MFLKKNSVFIILLTWLIVIFAKDDQKTNFDPGPDIPFFYYDAVSYPIINRDSIRLEIYVKVPFDAVQFLKEEDVFVAKYEISLLLLDEDEIQELRGILARGGLPSLAE